MTYIIDDALLERQSKALNHLACIGTRDVHAQHLTKICIIGKLEQKRRTGGCTSVSYACQNNDKQNKTISKKIIKNASYPVVLALLDDNFAVTVDLGVALGDGPLEWCEGANVALDVVLAVHFDSLLLRQTHRACAKKKKENDK